MRGRGDGCHKVGKKTGRRSQGFTGDRTSDGEVRNLALQEEFRRAEKNIGRLKPVVEKKFGKPDFEVGRLTRKEGDLKPLLALFDVARLCYRFGVLGSILVLVG